MTRASGATTPQQDELGARAVRADRLLDRGEVRAALDLLTESLLVDHRHAETLLAFSRAQLRWGSVPEAEAACRIALETRPGDPAALNQLAAVLISDDRAAEALAVLDEALARDPTEPVARRRRASTLRVLGRTEDARRILRDLNAEEPVSAEVLVNLAEVERMTPGHALIEQLRAAIGAAGPHDPQLAPLHYALGKALDQVGEHDEAFAHFREGGVLTRARVSYDEAAALATLARIPEIFTPALLSRPRLAQAQKPAPVFIVGMPRSGSTLVEQVLSQHPDVHCSGEIMALAEALADVRREAPELPLYPDFMPLIDEAALDRVAGTYRAAIERTADGASIHVNKLLGNFMFMGAIRLAMPDARFVVVRRDPLDSCLSAFALHFDQRVPYSYDLSELGRYYAAYRRTMAHWQTVLPPSCMHEVVYEALVEDLEGEARRLLGFLGLDWEPACLSFHESSRPVLTASIDQVRRPLYTSAIGRWQNYERHLGPLKAALGSG